MLLLLCRLLGRLPIGCTRRITVLARVLPSIREATLSYPLAIFTNSVWMPQRKGLRGLSEEEACSCAACMGAPQASSQPRPLPLPLASSVSSLRPLPLQLFAVPLLSSQPFSWTGGSRTEFTLARLELIFKITLKTTYIFNISLEIQFGEGPENIKRFCYWPKNDLISEVIVNPRYIVYDHIHAAYYIRKMWSHSGGASLVAFGRHLANAFLFYNRNPEVESYRSVYK